jgi:hypothetical protein
MILRRWFLSLSTSYVTDCVDDKYVRYNLLRETQLVDGPNVFTRIKEQFVQLREGALVESGYEAEITLCSGVLAIGTCKPLYRTSLRIPSQ